MVVSRRLVVAVLAAVLAVSAISHALAAPVPRIVGGSAVTPGDFAGRQASTVAVLDARTRSVAEAHFCGGTLIAPTKVVTAAHCVTDYVEDPFQVTVVPHASIDVLGGRRTLSGSGGERVDVTRIVVHRRFDAETLRFDIALLTLAKQPAGAQPVGVIGAGEGALWGNGAGLAVGADGPWIAGWGVFNYYHWWDGDNEPLLPADTLREADLAIVSDEACANGGAAAEGAGLGGLFHSGSMYCAGVLDSRDLNDHNAVNNGRDACWGDSGGGMLVSDGGGGYRLAGVVSWGLDCATRNFPGVYARVAAARDFVLSNPPDPIRRKKDPVASGLPGLGEPLTCTRGQWTGGAPISYRYRWLRSGGLDFDDWDLYFEEDEGFTLTEYLGFPQRLRRGTGRPRPLVRNTSIPTYFGWKTIPGARAATYRPTHADKGKWVRCEVQASNPSWSMRAASNQVGPIKLLPIPPQVAILGRSCSGSKCRISISASHPSGAKITQVAARWSRSSDGKVTHGVRYAERLKGSRFVVILPKRTGAWTVKVRAKDGYGRRSANATLRYRIG